MKNHKRIILIIFVITIFCLHYSYELDKHSELVSQRVFRIFYNYKGDLLNNIMWTKNGSSKDRSADLKYYSNTCVLLLENLYSLQKYKVKAVNKAYFELNDSYFYILEGYFNTNNLLNEDIETVIKLYDSLKSLSYELRYHYDDTVSINEIIELLKIHTEELKNILDKG